MAATLGISDDTMQKRVSRAVEKLRAYFAKRGEVLPSAVLLAAISGHGVEAAPPGLASAVIAGVFGSAAPGLLPPLVQSALTRFHWPSLGRTAFWGGAAAVIICGGVMTATQHIAARRDAAGLVVPVVSNATVQETAPKQPTTIQPVDFPAPALQPQPGVRAAAPGNPPPAATGAKWRPPHQRPGV
jgi:hypothetical protein